MEKFKSFLLKRLMDEITNDLKKDFHKDLGYDKESYDLIINTITTNYLKEKEILFIENNIKLDDVKCLARIWNNGYGNHQCSRKVIDCENKLCKSHNDLFIKDKLWLGLITDSRPNNPKRNGRVRKWND
jgi:hypothetical protein